MPPPTFIAALMVAAAALAWSHHKSQRKSPLPPGPTSYPIIGQLLEAPTSYEQFKYKIISERLKSDIISFQFLGFTIVVASSAQMATDIFEAHSNLYSDRPQTVMLTDPQLMNWGNAVLFTQYDNRLRAYHRIFNKWLSKSAIKTFHHHQVSQVRKTLRHFLTFGDKPISSEAVDQEIYRLTAATLLYAAYGYEVKSLEDRLVFLAKRAIDITSQVALPSNFLVNVIPSLVRLPEWVPGTSWKQLARKWRAEKDSAINEPFEWVKNQIANGSARPSIIQSMLENLNDPTTERGYKMEEEDCKNIAFTLFGGGSDTMAGTLMAFILAMRMFPEIQAKAQHEIDTVIGTSRLPEIDDKEDLPYVNNLIQEVMRWRPVLPLGVPHACSQDNVLNGYFIPKGTIVMGNVWAMSRDESIYRDPETFNPDRFLDPNTPPIPAFGWGRRKCPGTHLADVLMFTSIASILAAFNITGPGNPKKHNPYWDMPANGILYHPNPFSCKMVPRSEAHEALVQRAALETA